VTILGGLRLRAVGSCDSWQLLDRAVPRRKEAVSRVWTVCSCDSWQLPVGAGPTGSVEAVMRLGIVRSCGSWQLLVGAQMGGSGGMAEGREESRKGILLKQQFCLSYSNLYYWQKGNPASYKISSVLDTNSNPDPKFPEKSDPNKNR